MWKLARRALEASIRVRLRQLIVVTHGGVNEKMTGRIFSPGGWIEAFVTKIVISGY